MCNKNSFINSWRAQRRGLSLNSCGRIQVGGCLSDCLGDCLSDFLSQWSFQCSPVEMRVNAFSHHDPQVLLTSP